VSAGLLPDNMEPRLTLALIGLHPLDKPFPANEDAATNGHVSEPREAGHFAVDSVGNMCFGAAENRCDFAQGQDFPMQG
jgi:hypothetical protein